jgi:hypothetical protein
MVDINRSNLVEETFRYFPELLPAYVEDKKKFNEWRIKEIAAGKAIFPPFEEHFHLIFGDTINAFIIKLITEGGNEERLKEIFAHFEVLSNSPDESVQNVMLVTVCENLGAREGLISETRKYMGPAMRKLSVKANEESGRLI